jgi:hypothetical protein
MDIRSIKAAVSRVQTRGEIFIIDHSVKPTAFRDDSGESYEQRVGYHSFWLVELVLEVFGTCTNLMTLHAIFLHLE